MTTTERNLSAIMKDVALHLLGEPTQKKGKEYRWGRQGSLAVDTEKGTFYDFEAQEGGGVLDLIARHNGSDKAEAARWLEDNGFLEVEPAAPRASFNYNPDRFWLTSRGADVRTSAPVVPASEHAVNLRSGQIIVATFDYYGQYGDLLYRNHRIEPGDHGSHKTFRYDHPDGKGGWSAGAGTADKVPYRLPQLLASKEPLYMVEGEAQAEHLAAWGFVATSLKGWKDEWSRMIAGRKVYVLPDNDEPGQKQAQKTIASLETYHCEVSVITLPDLPDKGDILDWHGTREDLLAMTNEASDADNGPVDIWASLKPMELPDHLLPKVIADFARENAKQTGTCAAGFALAALVASAGAIDDAIRIKVPRHENWTERACIWGLLVGDPSTKKSPIFRKATNFLMRKNQEMETRHKRDLIDWQDDGGPKSGQPRPVKKKLVLNNTTNEAALEVAAADPRGLCLFSDEIAGFFKRIESYGASDNSMWLESYNGGYQSVDRVGREAASAENFSLCILGGIQPDRIKKMREALSDDGMLQRFIPVMLERAGEGIDAPSPPVNDIYETMLARLLECSIDRERNFMNQPIKFNERGQQIREEFTRQTLAFAEEVYDTNKSLSNHLRKHEALFPRLCLIWHCIEAKGSAIGPEIEDSIPERVSEFLLGFVQSHAMCFYEELMDAASGDAPIRDVASYILTSNATEITLREVRRRCKRMEALLPWQRDEVMGYLEAGSWLTRTPGARSDSSTWMVNPEVHKMYAEKAAREAEKKASITRKMNRIRGGKGPHG